MEGAFFISSDLSRSTYFVCFLSAFIGSFQLVLLLYRRFFVRLASTILFYDPVCITKSLELLECTLNSKAIRNIDADFVFWIFFSLVGHESSQLGWQFFGRDSITL